MDHRTHRNGTDPGVASRRLLYGACLVIGCLGCSPPLFPGSDGRDVLGDFTGDTIESAEVAPDSESSFAHATASAPPEQVFSFKNGENGYHATIDIELRQAYPSIAYPSNQTLRAYSPLDVNDGTEQQVLVRFHDIFGDAKGRIPQDAKIVRASLILWGTAPTTGNIFLHHMLRDWTGDASWDSLMGGVSRNNLEARETADARFSAYHSAGQFYTFDVRESLAAWQVDPPKNFGWLVFSDSADGFEFAASEYMTPALRPHLEVELAWQSAPRVERIAPTGDDALSASTAPTLAVTADDPDGGPVNIVFFGREKRADKWTLVALPDTQFYASTAAYNDIFMSQTEWIVNQREALNIQMVVHEGDIVDDPLSQAQWDVANAALSLLMDNDIPFAPVPGNHDHAGWQSGGDTALYSATFPASAFEPYLWWEAGSDFNGNTNNTVTLTIGSEAYLFIALDFCPFPEEIEWANGVLDAHPNHKAILTTHAYIRDSDGAYTGTSCPDTSYIFDDLVDRHDNLQIVLCGHMHAGDGEFYRADYNSNDRIVHQLVADYQSRERGGNGRLRIMTFDPSTDTIHVQTYSPYTGYYETDADSDFSLSYDMAGGSPFLELGTVSDLPSGGLAELAWTRLNRGTTYEWYVIVTGAEQTTVSPVWELTTVD